MFKAIFQTGSEGKIFPTINNLNRLPQYSFDITDAYGPNAHKFEESDKVTAFLLENFAGGSENVLFMGYERSRHSISIRLEEVMPILSPEHVGVWCATAIIPKFALKFESGKTPNSLTLVACVYVEDEANTSEKENLEWVVVEPVSNSRAPLDGLASSVLSSIWIRLSGDRDK